MVSQTDPAIYENGIRYVPVKNAAKAVGLVPDYISRMCREKMVRATRHAGIWYVEEDSLTEFIKSQAAEYEKFKRRKALAGKTILRESRTPVLHKQYLPLAAGATGLLVIPILAFLIFPPRDVAREQFASASAPSFFERVSSAVFSAFCPIFNSCPAPSGTPTLVVTPSPPPTPVAQLPPPPPTVPTSRPPAPPPTTIAQSSQPRVFERVTVERVISEGGISEAFLNSRLFSLETKLRAEISSSSVAYSPDTARIYQLLSSAGGGGGGSSVTNVTNVSGVDSFIELNDAPSSLVAGDILYADATNSLAALASSTDGLVLKLVNGFPSWASDIQGSGGSSAWATTTNNLAIVETDTTDVVVIGASGTSTTGNILEVSGASLFRGALVTYGTLTVTRMVATSSIASNFPYASTTAITTSVASTSLLYADGLGGCSVGQYLTWSNGAFGCSTDQGSSFSYLFPNNATTTLLNFNGGLTAYASSTIGNGTQAGGLTISGGATTTGNAYFAGSVGIGTTSPYAKFSVVGPVVAEYFHATSTTATSTFSGMFTAGPSVSVPSFEIFQNGNITFGYQFVPSDDYVMRVDKANDEVLMGNTLQFVNCCGTGVNLIQGNTSDMLVGTYWDATQGNNSRFGGDSSNYFSASVNGFLKLVSGGVERVSVSPTSGNTGIGTTTPWGKLAISINNGDSNANAFVIASSTQSATTTLFVVSNTGTTTVANGVEILAGCFRQNGACITSGSGASFAYLFPNNATSTLLNFNGGLTAYASSTIGNGTQTGGLTVSGGATTTGNAYFAGNVGIGTTSPGYKLEVTGTTKLNGDITLGDNDTAIAGNSLSTYTFSGGRLIFNSTNVGTVFQHASNETMRLTGSNTVGIASSSPWALLSVSPNGLTGPAFAIGSSSATKFVVSNGGNVGIGTMNPITPLHILNGTTSNIYLGSTNANEGEHQIGFGFHPLNSSAVTIVGKATGGSGRGFLDFRVADGGDTTTATSGDAVLRLNAYSIDVMQPFSYVQDTFSMGINHNAGTKALKFTRNENKAAIWSVPEGTHGRADLRFTTGNNTDSAAKTEADAVVRIGSNGGVVIGNAFIANNPFDGNLLVGTSTGIGTSSPAAVFSLAGTSGIYASTTATSTFQGGGINLLTAAGNTGCFAVNGVCITSGSSSNFGYLFPDNATSTLLNFNGGLTAYASSTIGGGSTTTGLTVIGAATTSKLVLSDGGTSADPAIKFFGRNGFYSSGDNNLTVAFQGGNSAIWGNTGFRFFAQVRVPTSGGATTPGLAFESDTNTGVYNAAADNLGFVTGGAERARFDASGNFGIATTSPYALFSLAATSTTGLNAPTTLFTIASTTGGTATTTLFSIGNTGLVTGLDQSFQNSTTTSLFATTASTSRLYVTGLGGCGGGQYLTWSGGTFGCATDVAGGGFAFPFTPVPTFGSTPANATSTLIGFTSGIYALASSTIGNGTQIGGLTISGGATTTGNAYFANRLMVGTTSALAKLHVEESLDDSLPIAFFEHGRSLMNQADYLDGFMVGARTGAGLDGSMILSMWTDNIQQVANIQSALVNNIYTNLALNPNDGNVGVGTSTPNIKFQVEKASTVYNSDLSYAARFGVLGRGVALGYDTTADAGVITAVHSGVNWKNLALNPNPNAGNVGIGTTTPGQLLTMSGDTPYLRINRTTQSSGQVGVQFSSGGGVADWFIYQPSGSNDLRFWALGAGGQDRVTFASGGNVGIGSSTPWGKLSITNENSTPSFVVEDQGSPDSSPFIIDADGNTGIGTTSPYAKLSVFAGGSYASQAASTLFTIGSSTAGTATTTLFSINSAGLVTGLDQSFTNSTTTSLAVTNIANGSLLKVAAGGAVVAAVAGTDFAVSPFTWLENFGVINAATTSTIWAQSGINASSTSRFVDTVAYGIFTFATSSANASSSLVKFNGSPFITASSTGFNTSLGEQALPVNTSGSQNTAAGYRALWSNTTGSNNTGFGRGALIFNNTGTDNTSVGYRALGGNGIATNSHSRNVAVGSEAMSRVTTGADNIAIGQQTLNYLTTGSRNVFIGRLAGGALSVYTSGNDSVAVGNGAMNLASGSNNTAIGVSALNSASGGYNIGIGYQSGYTIDDGIENIIIGGQLTTGAGNLTDGHGNIGMGYNTFFPSATANRQLVIGGLIYGILPATTTSFRLPTSGTIGIGTTTSEAKFAVASNFGDTTPLLFLVASSSINATTTLFSISNTGAINATGSITSTANSASVFPYASSTALTAGSLFATSANFTNATTTTSFSDIASSTYLYGGALTNCSGGFVLTWSNGKFGCSQDLTNTGANDFTWLSHFGSINAATSSTLWAQAGINASSTSNFHNLAVYGTVNFATSSNHGALASFSGSTFITASSTGFNTSLGQSALAAVTSGNQNTAVGYQALQNATSTIRNVAVGYQALRCDDGVNCSGTDNNAFGHSALSNIESGSGNNAFGSSALGNLTTGNSNAAFGGLALFANSTGGNNSAFGGGALQDNQTGDNNTAVGAFALGDNNTGSRNVVLGASALGIATSSSDNVALGWSALVNLRTGPDNDTEGSVAIGREAGASVTYGGGNILIGYQAGDAITTGSRNIVIGSDIDAPSATLSNQLNIGNLIFGTNLDGQESTLSTGSIGIGTTTPGSKLDVHLGGSSGYGLTVNRTSGANVGFYVDGTYGWVGTKNAFPLGLFTTDAAVPQAVLHTSGNFQIGTTTTDSSARLFVQRDQDASTISGIANYNPGASAYATLAFYNDTGSATNAAIFRNSSANTNFGGANSLNMFNFSNAGLTFGTNSLERLHITADGNVGIGTSSPRVGLSFSGSSNWGTMDLVGNTANGESAINIRSADDSHTQGWLVGKNLGLTDDTFSIYRGGNLFNITTGGNVGIGTTTPSALLHTSVSGSPNFTFMDTFGGANSVVGRRWNNTVASPTALVANDEILAIGGRGYAGSAMGSSVKAMMVIGAEENWTDLAQGTFMTLHTTASGGTTRSEKLRLTGAGLLGIGTTTPQWLLNPTSATAPQLALSAGADLSQWTFRNAGGNFFLSTTTIAGTATTSISAFTIDGSNGKVGIGTDSPGGYLTIRHDNPNATTSLRVINIGPSSGGPTAIEFANFTSNDPYTRGQIIAGEINSGLMFSTSAGGAPTEKMRIAAAGNVGVATTSPWRKLSVDGTVGFSSSLSALSGTDNTLCIDPVTYEVSNDGGILGSCGASSIRYKEDVQNISYGLDAVLQMRPVSFKWKESERPGDHNRYLGFIAEEMYEVIPEVVGFDSEGKVRSLGYEYLTAVLAKAIQEQNLNLETIASTSATTTPASQSFATNFFGNIFARITSWLADTGNGIAKLFAKEVYAQRIEADELCARKADGTPVCVTGEELETLINGQVAGAAGASTPPPPPAAPESSATLSLNGNNPAEWPLNNPWQDNLGALFSHDGNSETIYSTSTVDTAIVGTTTIDYWATVPSSGETLHETRTVVVVGEETPSQEPESEPVASSTPPVADDTQDEPLTEGVASSTSATSTTP